MRFVGRGHPAVRATHDKTLEFSPEPDITARATCIVSVATRVEQPRPFAGPLRITITAAGQSATLDAVGNPGWDPTGPAVVRRSPVRSAGTFATEATVTAAGLPRLLAEALRDPATEVVVEVEPLPGAPTVVLVALDPLGAPGDRRLAAEFAAADLVVAEDGTAARLLGERAAHGPVEVDGRVLVVASEDLPGRAVVHALATARLETVGLPPGLAAAACAPARGPLLVAPDGADLPQVLRRSAAGTRVVVPTTADRAPHLLTAASAVLGSHHAVLATADRPPVRLVAGDRPPGRDAVSVCVVGDAGAEELDPAVRAAVEGLLADGVPTKAVARALATLTGEPQRRAYDTVLGLRSAT